METITNTIMRKTDGLTKEYRFNLPIDKICDISVWVEIEFSYKRIRLRINSASIYDDEYGNRSVLFLKTIEKIEVSNLKSSMTKLFEDLNNLELNTFKGCLQVKTETSNTEQEVKLALKSLIKNENIKTTINECCVCLEPTLSFLQCRHHICLLCYEKIEFTPCDCDDCDNEERKCPLCRQGDDVSPNMVNSCCELDKNEKIEM